MHNFGRPYVSVYPVCPPPGYSEPDLITPHPNVGLSLNQLPQPRGVDGLFPEERTEQQKNAIGSLTGEIAFDGSKQFKFTEKNAFDSAFNPSSFNPNNLVGKKGNVRTVCNTRTKVWNPTLFNQKTV